MSDRTPGLNTGRLQGPDLPAWAVTGLWAVLVLVPFLLTAWLAEGLQRQYRASAVRQTGRRLERAARRLFHESHPRFLAARRLDAPTPGELPPHPAPQDIGEVLALLRDLLRTGRLPDQISLLRLKHRLGWTFDLFSLRGRPGIATEILWDGRPGWLAWKPDGPGGNVRTEVVLPPPRALSLRDRCQEAAARAGVAWAVTDRASRRWWRSPTFADPVPGLLRAIGPRDRGTLVHGGRLVWFDRVGREGRFLVSTPLPVLARPDLAGWLPLAGGAALLLVSLVFPTFCRRFLAWSLRWKLLALAAYLVSVPLALALLLGLGFLNGRRETLEGQRLTASLSDLQLFDAEFLRFLQTVEVRLHRLHGQVARSAPDPAALARLAEPMFRGLVTDRLLLLASDGQVLLDRCSDHRTDSLLNEVGTGFLRQELERQRPIGPPPETSQRFRLFHESIRNSTWGSHYHVQGVLQKFLFGTRIFYTFWRLFARGHPTLGIMAADLFHQDTSRAFLARGRGVARTGACRLFTWHGESGTWFPTPPPGRPDLEALVEASRRSGEPETGEVETRAGRTLALAVPAHHLLGCVLVGVLPAGEEERVLAERRGLLLTGTGLTLALALACWVLLTQGLLLPVREILAGIARLRRLETHPPIPVLGDDELARLAKGINRMMDITDELDLARVVQRAFVPEAPPPLQRWRIAFWESRRLGVEGAFFDWYPCPDGQWAVLLGTATGSGVRSALIMAMVKAQAFLHFRGNRPPEGFLDRVREALPDLGVTRACMALSLLVIDEAGARLAFVGAGSPFALVRSAPPGPGAPVAVDFVGSPSPPLGARAAGSFPAVSVPLGPGKALLLFTTGVAHAAGPDGQPLGFEALREAFAAADPRAADPLRPLRERLQQHVQGGGRGKEAFLLVWDPGPPAEGGSR
ncbi:MAG: SpoIIE family protein phosphatase [Candidatus Riflebacteria bacterium]|nr:SpoIIE family protein phosphatase [Candidatus Riflebacteria bacterium]